MTLCSDCPPNGFSDRNRCDECPRRARSGRLMEPRIKRGPFRAGQYRGPYTEAGAKLAHDRAMSAGFTKSGVIFDLGAFYLLVD